MGFENYKIVDDSQKVLEESDIIYIVVPTPSLSDGSFDTSYLENVIDDFGEVKFSCRDKLLVITSTVLPGDIRSKLISPIRTKKGTISEIGFVIHQIYCFRFGSK